MAGFYRARTFDWEFWRESARSLHSAHLAVARDYDDFPWERQTVEEGKYNETKAAYSGLFDQVLKKPLGDMQAVNNKC